ncbi:MAG: hypothetical protein ACD_72C00358G0005 [uncultured bacterium]|nr:MAG: hypothetical protein ACD_72C00358G0005 [uncultured bacterium]
MIHKLLWDVQKRKTYMPKKSNLIIGLIGNPNVGKSTLFNSLTGARQKVGNWPGKTVEKKEGAFTWQDQTIKIVDLPGTYSLSAYTSEETVVIDFVKEEKPKAIIQIIDAQNLTRNLFLTLQLLELKVKLVLAVNMLDLAKSDGIHIDLAELSQELGVPVVPINARNKKEMPNFLREVIGHLEKDDVGEKKSALSKFLIQHIGDAQYINKRYKWIKELEKNVVKRDFAVAGRDWNRRLDAVVMHKYFGIPVFLITIWFVFQATFKFSAPLSGWIQSFFAFLSVQLTQLLSGWGVSRWFISLFTEGIIGGVGSVLVFVPSIGILFLLISILEDTGYMARVAYVMDRFMHKLGLHGRAFIPLIVGFGCNVPGIMATRTLETKQERLLTILISPFITCSARLPVYVLFAGIFFSKYQSLVIVSLYALSIIITILMGLLFKKIFSKQISAELIIELPPYRFPTLFGLLLHIWEKMGAFVKKAGTIILAFSIIIWLLASLPSGVAYGSHESFAGSIGQTIAPLFTPLGFNNWQSGVALAFGLIAKEVIVSTFGTLHGVTNIATVDPSGALSLALQQYFTPLSAYAFLVFVLLYAPCAPTMAVIKKETGSIKWTAFVITYTILVAYITAFIIYQLGKLIGLQ